MSDAHTPGPWAFDPEEMAQGAEDIFTVTIRGPGANGSGLRIASICAFEILSETLDGCNYVTVDAPAEEKLAQAKANARLIVAAPDLLAALKLANANSKDRIDEPWRQVVAAAIAKAIGDGQ